MIPTLIDNMMLACDDEFVRIDLREPAKIVWISKEALLEVINEYEEWHTLKENKRMPKGTFDKIMNDDEE